MTKTLRFFLAVALATPVLARAADPPPDPKKATTGSLELGAWSSSFTGSPDVVSPYDPADLTRPATILGLDSRPEWGNVRLDARFYDKNSQRHELEFDVGRVLRSRTIYERFLPRLGHDPLTNLEAAVRSGRIVQYTDKDPQASYDLERGLLDHRTEIQPRGLSALTLGLNYRDQRWRGAHQALAVSHCDTCHVVSQTHRVEQNLRQGSFDAMVTWVKGYLRAEVGRRQLRQGVPSVDLLYDRALQPELRTPIFDNRVTFDALEGAQRVDHLHDANKSYGKVDLNLADVGGFRVNAGGVWSGTENLYTNLKSDYQGYSLNASRQIRRLTLRMRGRAYFLSNDDVFVDSPERVGAAGPQAGRTYRQIYGYNPDYLRQSVLNRDVYETNAELAYKINKRLGTLRAWWSFQSIDRESYQVAAGVTRTETNVLGLSWRPAPAKGLKVHADYRHGFVDHPFMLMQGSCSNVPAIGPLASPLLPASIQYFAVHETRLADTTAAPAGWDEVRLRSSYSRPKASFTGTYRFWDGTNREGNLTDWSRTSHLATATLWTTPSPRWDAFVSYSYQKADLGSRVCIPVFDG